MRVALVHDSLTQLGGAERVLEALHELYPDAPVFTLVLDKKLKAHFSDWTVVSSPLQYLYNFVPRFQLMLPFMRLGIKFFNFSGYDLVISSSSALIKNLSLPKGVVHICYCHTPARFLWTEMDSYVDEEVPAILRSVIKIYLRHLRKWDFKSAQKIDYFIANSKNVQQRIKKYYKRESIIIYPSIDSDKFYPSADKQQFYLVVGRQQAHKRTDLVIQAFNELGKPLHIIGAGRALAHLQKLAKENIVFLGRVSDQELVDEFSAARALVFAQEEDFGLVPLEAMAAGTPVIAYAAGGALETVIAHKTGVLFETQTKAALIQAVHQFEQEKFYNEDLFEQAQKFSKTNFQKQFADFVSERVK